MSASKQALREAVLTARLQLPPDVREARSRAACERLVALDEFAAAGTLAAYAAMGSEADPAAAVEAALQLGKRVAYPRLDASSRRLVFAATLPNTLVAGSRGTREPPPGAPAVALHALDLVIVPGIAFDASGRRLGRGGGYYDATLAALPAHVRRVGLAFDLQIVDLVPDEPHDAAVEIVVTESRVLRAAR